jgi:hypothetical protein
MPCLENCVCPVCLERTFRGNDHLAETYLKTRKQAEQREKRWKQQDQEREKRRIQKREETDRLIWMIDLELKRRLSNKCDSAYSI